MPQHPAAREQKSHLPSGEYAAIVRARAEAAAAAVSPPPAGLPADPTALLAYLEAGVFTPEQVKYLQNHTALDKYEAGIASARAVPGADVALAEKILAVWLAWLEKNPAPASNPFGSIA